VKIPQPPAIFFPLADFFICQIPAERHGDFGFSSCSGLDYAYQCYDLQYILVNPPDANDFAINAI
jgi:hypothetical protein